MALRPQLGPLLRSLRRRKSAAALLVLEVALGMVVLVNNVVIGAHYWNLTFASSGVDESDLLFVTRRAGATTGATELARDQAAADLARIVGLPDVVAAAAVDELPFQDTMQLPTVVGTIAPVVPTAVRTAVAWPLRASAGVVEALGLRLLHGRVPAAGEYGVALVTSTLANRLAPAGDIVGRRIRTDGLSELQVVGVVRDFRVRIPMAPDHHSVLIAAELPVSARELNYVVRGTHAQLTTLAARIPEALGPGRITAQVPDLSVGRAHRIARGALIVMVWMTLIVVGVALAGALAVTSFSVSERTRQIGVRRALGATRGDILRYFLGENALMTSVGIAIGLAVTLPLNALMGRLNLMPVATWWQVGLSMVLFWTAGLLSALAPARRAARIPPTAATRTV